MKRHALIAVVLPVLVAGFFAGCESDIRPLQDLERVELWIPADGSPAIELSPPTPVPVPAPLGSVAGETQKKEATTIPAKIEPINVATSSRPAPSDAATEQADTAPAMSAAESQPAATEPMAATTEPAGLPPGHKVIKIIDPNETARFVYKGDYDNIWQRSMVLLSRMGFTLDRQDYRLGVITTKTLPSAQIVEPWKPAQAGVTNAMEDTVNSQRRSVRLTISTVPGKPDFYQIAVQVLVERETNPTEQLLGPLFIEGSGFGRSQISLQSDYAEVSATGKPVRWIMIGHDPKLEKKVLDQLFSQI